MERLFLSVKYNCSVSGSQFLGNPYNCANELEQLFFFELEMRFELARLSFGIVK